MEEDLATVIPHTKLFNSISNSRPVEGKTNVIVITTGSMCPIHL